MEPDAVAGYKRNVRSVLIVAAVTVLAAVSAGTAAGFPTRSAAHASDGPRNPRDIDLDGLVRSAGRIDESGIYERVALGLRWRSRALLRSPHRSRLDDSVDTCSRSGIRRDGRRGQLAGDMQTFMRRGSRPAGSGRSRRRRNRPRAGPPLRGRV